MTVLGRYLCVLLIFARISICTSQQKCEAVDGEVTYPDRCDIRRNKDLCRRGQYVKISSIFCDEGNGSADDRCVPCEEETYMPNYNYCPFCLATTKCKDNKIESRAPTSTSDRECILNPVTAPPVTPTCNCPVCESPTQSSCSPCPTLQELTTDLYSHTSGQETSDSPTTVVSSAANATREPVYRTGDEAFWMWVAIGLGVAVVVAILVIVVLVCILCRSRRERQQGECPPCKKNGDNVDIEMGNLPNGCGGHEPNENCVGGVNRQNEMGNRNLPNGPWRHEPDEVLVGEDHAVNRQNEMGNRNLPNGPWRQCKRNDDNGAIEMGNHSNGPGRHEPDEVLVGEDHAVNRQNEMGNRNLPNGPWRHEPDEVLVGEDHAVNRQNEMGNRNLPNGPWRQCKRNDDNGAIEMGNHSNGPGRHEPDEVLVGEDHAVNRQNEMGNRNLPNGPWRHEPDEVLVGEDHAVNRQNEMGNRNLPNGPWRHEPDEVLVGEDHAVNGHNDSGISSPGKDKALELQSNSFPAEDHLNPGPSTENTTSMYIQPPTKGSSILTNGESGSYDISGNTPSTQPLLRSGPETNHSPPHQNAKRDAETGNGSKGFQNKGPSKQKLNESMQPLLGNSTSMSSSISSLRYDGSCILEADDGTEKPCGRTTFCVESHINLVKDEIAVGKRASLFDKLNIRRKKQDEICLDNERYGSREQIRGVLLWWLQTHEEQPIFKLFRALKDSGNADVITVFKKEFNVKAIE